MKKIILSLITITFLLSGCKPLNRYSDICYDCGFNTVWNWIIYTENENKNNQYEEMIKESVTRYNKLFDIYNNYENINNIKTINDNAGIKPIEVDEEIIEMLKISKEIYELSNGKFDITQGALLKVWHKVREDGKTLNELGVYGILPDENDLIEASKHHGFEHIIIDEENSTVYIDDPDISLDVGGIAKGYTVEKIALMLEENGIKHASIVGGGNVRTINDKADGTPWGVAIQDPRSSQEYSYDGIINVFTRNSVSVVTSGNYFNYYIAEGNKKMHHIINPDTLYPSDLYESVSVIVSNSGLADALSTSLFNMNIEEGMKFIQRVEDYYDVEIEVLWVLSENNPEDIKTQNINGLNVYMTDDFTNYTIK